MGTCGCHWARGRREAPAAKVAAGERMPLARHTLRAGGCRRTGRAYAPLHCSLAAALTAMGLRHRPQSGSCHDRARLPQTCTIMGWSRRPQCEVHLRYPAPLDFRAQGLANVESWQICAPCMIRGACAAKRAPSWQDIHVVYPPTTICRAFQIHGTHILPKPTHFEYTAAICCHEGALSPTEAIFGIHRGKILPSSDTWERITSTYRHRQTLGNAFRGHLAVAERPRVHCEHTLLCAGLRGMHFAGMCCHARLPDGAPRQHIASKATLRLRKGQYARSRHTPPEPTRGMRRCPAAAVGTAAMKEPGH